MIFSIKAYACIADNLWLVTEIYFTPPESSSFGLGISTTKCSMCDYTYFEISLTRIQENYGRCSTRREKYLRFEITMSTHSLCSLVTIGVLPRLVIVFPKHEALSVKSKLHVSPIRQVIQCHTCFQHALY